MALDAIDELVRLNFSIPEDIAVIGFDNISFSSQLKYLLTTCSNPTYIDQIKILINSLKIAFAGKVANEIFRIKNPERLTNNIPFVKFPQDDKKNIEVLSAILRYCKEDIDMHNLELEISGVIENKWDKNEELAEIFR